MRTVKALIRLVSGMTGGGIPRRRKGRGQGPASTHDVGLRAAETAAELAEDRSSTGSIDPACFARISSPQTARTSSPRRIGEMP